MYVFTLTFLLWLLGFIALTRALKQPLPPRMPKRLTSKSQTSDALEQYKHRLDTHRTKSSPPTTRLANVSDLLLLLEKGVFTHPLITTIVNSFHTTAYKLFKREVLSLYETGLAGFVLQHNISPETPDIEVIKLLMSFTEKELDGMIPKPFQISIAEIEELMGYHMEIPDGCKILRYGDHVSIDDDMCVCIFYTLKNAFTFLYKKANGMYALRPFSTKINKGDDLSQLVLLEKKRYSCYQFITVLLFALVPCVISSIWLMSIPAILLLSYMLKTQRTELVPGEVRCFYRSWYMKVYLKEVDGKPVHIDGTPIPADVQIEYEVVFAVTPSILERYMILYTTGRGPEFEGIKCLLSIKLLAYKKAINDAKIKDLVHWSIRHLPHMLAEVEVLVHILKTVYHLPETNPLVLKLVAFKQSRDELFSQMKTDGIDAQFMRHWYDLVRMAFTLNLHDPSLIEFLNRTGKVEGLTAQHTEAIAKVMSSFEMNRLTFMKNFTFRLLQVLYGYHACLHKDNVMLYVKEILAYEVAPILKSLGVSISVDVLVAILHRNFSQKDDIRPSSTLHLHFEELVVKLAPKVILIFTGEVVHVATGLEKRNLWTAVCAPAFDSSHVSHGRTQIFCSDCVGKLNKCHRCVEEEFLATEKRTVPIPEMAQGQAQIRCVDSANDCEGNFECVDEALQNQDDGITVFMLWDLMKTSKNHSEESTWFKVNNCYLLSWQQKSTQLMKKWVDKIPDLSKKTKIRPDRVQAILMLLDTKFFGHGYEAFKNGKPQGMDAKAYNPLTDIEEIRKLVSTPSVSTSQPSSQPSSQQPSKKGECAYSKCYPDIQATFERLNVIQHVVATLQMRSKKAFVVVVDAKIPQQEESLSFDNYVLYVVSVYSKAMAKDKFDGMTKLSTTQDWNVFLGSFPSTSSHPLVGEKKMLSHSQLLKELKHFLKEKNISVSKIMRHGSSLHQVNRLVCGDVDYIVMIKQNPATITISTFIASDGTKCDMMFTTKFAKSSVEQTVAELMGEKWHELTSFFQSLKDWWTRKKVEQPALETQKVEQPALATKKLEQPALATKKVEQPVLETILQSTYDAYGKKAHVNDNHMNTTPHPGAKCHYAYQTVKMMMTLMLLVINRREFPRYNALAFYPKTFDKREFTRFLMENDVDPYDIVSLFTKQQLELRNGSLILKSGEKKFVRLLAMLPQEWIDVVVEFKQIALELTSNDESAHKSIAVVGVQATVAALIPFLVSQH